MFSPTSATEAAFLVVALMQAVFALLWAIGAGAVLARGPVVHWAAWSAMSAVTWLTLSQSLDSPPLLGILIGVLGVMMLERGVRLFMERRPRDRLHVALLFAVIGAHEFLVTVEQRYLLATLNYGVLALLYFNIARDVYDYSRHDISWRWAPLLAVPMSIGALMCLLRAMRAFFDPASIATVMTTDSVLNFRTALITVGVALTWHATLVALVVGRLMSELHRLSRHDALTGLLNRRAMEEALLAQLQHSRRTADPFVVMMLDLDHFKRINDQYGHPIGDLALKHVAQLLSGAMRKSDRLARFGGEEFVTLLPGATLADAEPIAEKLRALLSQSPLAHDEGSVMLSVSIGIAQWRDARDDASTLLSHADAALFQAKVQGRNRVVVAKELTAAMA